MATWYTPEQARADWADAPKVAERLQNLLDASKYECILAANNASFLDPLTGLPLPDAEQPQVIPAGWREAHLMQARAIWTHQQTNAADEAAAMMVGMGGVRVYPMDANVRQRLRPHSPSPKRLVG